MYLIQNSRGINIRLDVSNKNSEIYEIEELCYASYSFFENIDTFLSCYGHLIKQDRSATVRGKRVNGGQIEWQQSIDEIKIDGRGEE